MDPMTLDAQAVTQPVHLLSYKGRIGRLRFVAYLTGAYLLFSAIAVALAMAGSFGEGTTAEALAAMAGFVFLLFTIFTTIQRSHDMNWTGWSWLWTLVPLVVLIWVFQGGTRGPNRFGAPPPRNTAGVYLLAWLLPATVALFIAIAVSVPGYKEYLPDVKPPAIEI